MEHSANTDNSPYNYDGLIAAADAILPSFRGRVLDQCLVEVVEPEYNLAYLLFTDQTFAICGRIGGEVLGIQAVDVRPSVGPVSDVTTVVRFPSFDQFAGKRIAAARTIGTAWNGHGFEFSFDGIYDRTLIVQSIYAGAVAPDRSDCLRLGVGMYSSAWPATVRGLA